MSKRMLLLLGIALLLFGGIFGYKAFVDRMINQAFDSMPPDPASITASEAYSERWQPRLASVGTFRPVNGAELTVEIGGTVTAVNFANGERVTKGQVLVELDTRVDRAELDQLIAARDLAELELERRQRLFRQSSVSEADLQRADSEAVQARAAVAARRAQIEQKTVIAPFDGRTGLRAVNVGQFLAAGSPVVSLQALDPLFLEFSLSQRFVPLVEVGQAVSVQVDAFPDEQFEGRINAIEPALSVTTRSVMIQATVANADERLRPGMFGRIELALGEADELLVVPQTAIRFATYGNSVFVIEGEGDDLRVVQRFVETGETRGDLIEIRSGLEAGQRVATSGLLKLQNDGPVRIEDEPSVQPDAQAEPTPDNG